MSNQNNIYASLNVCYYDIDEGLPQKKKAFNDLGSATNVFLNVYLPANATFASSMYEKYYPKKRPFYVPNIPTTTLGVNYGVVAFLFKKAEGKDNERAAGEAALEFVASWQGGNLGGYAGNITKTLAIKTASRVGIAMAARILGGCVGSVIPVGGTIVGAIAGAWIAGWVEEWWFADEDTQLEKDKAYNEAIGKQAKEYERKINAINDYLTRHHYIELRVLDEQEAKMLCKEASDLQSHYLNTIKLMLSYKDYLGQDILESRVSESTLTQPHAKSLENNPPHTTQADSKPLDSETSASNSPTSQPPESTHPFSIQPLQIFNPSQPISPIKRLAL